MRRRGVLGLCLHLGFARPQPCVLLAIGRPHEIAHGSLRLTLSEETTEEEIDYTVGAVRSVVERLRGMSPVWRDKVEGKKPFLL